MTQGNRAIRDHELEGRELHLFEAYGTELEYVGEFRYHDDYQADAPEVGDGPVRKVIVFRLEQVTGSDAGPARARLDRLGSDRVKEIPVEQALTETMLIEGDREPYEAERREQRLVRAFRDELERLGHEVCRLQFVPDGEAAPLFCDLFDKTENTLFEAKGTVTRAAIRMAMASSPTMRGWSCRRRSVQSSRQRSHETTSSPWRKVRKSMSGGQGLGVGQRRDLIGVRCELVAFLKRGGVAWAAGMLGCLG